MLKSPLHVNQALTRQRPSEGGGGAHDQIGSNRKHGPVRLLLPSWDHGVSSLRGHFSDAPQQACPRNAKVVEP